jgi:hypothetical protein
MAHQLLRRATCPHCWTPFLPEEVLWVSSHEDLLGDPRLGPDQLQRFLPTRFNIDGNAIDAKGLACHSLACPRCHLSIPRAVLEMETLFVSILGTPVCGKSYFLSALTWELRRILPAHFALSFGEADTVSNRSLTEYENALFLNPNPHEPAPVLELIRKTELEGDLYDKVNYGAQPVSYPRAFLFILQALQNHPNFRWANKLARTICLYDNAGEHFQVGRDTTANPVTHHLAHSKFLLFLFDPTQDVRFRALCASTGAGQAETSQGQEHTYRQESVLLEAAARVRRYAGLPQNAKHKRPLIVVLTKMDRWRHLLANTNFPDPWVARQNLSGFDLEAVDWRSKEIRALMIRVCPEIVNAAESFAESVVYIPVSALGRSPEIDPRTNALSIRPRDIKPTWVTVPLLYGICRWMTGFIPICKRRPEKAEASRSSTATRPKVVFPK